MSKIRYEDIPWEDEDNDASRRPVRTEDVEDFAKMLAEAGDVGPLQVRVGEAVEGVISALGASDTVVIDLGNHVFATIDKHELTDDAGELRYQQGDSIRAYVVSRSHDEIRLSTALSQSKQAGQDLFHAFKGKIPVQGKVEKENKGGFDVLIFGKKAFCPVSQIDSQFVQDKTAFLGKTFNFLIEKYAEGGRNIVVSRRAILAQEAARKLAELEAGLSENKVLEGTIRELRDYGAFVDLGGLDGFLHISEVSHARVNNIRDFLSVGEVVRVAIAKIEESDGKKRISLSMKAVSEDPWTTVGERLDVGSAYPARITRLETFGAFAEIEPGLEGLIHVSEMSWVKRINHPSEILKVGDTVQVRVVEIATDKRRISLSLKDLASDPWQTAEERLAGRTLKGQVTSLKGFGAIVDLGDGITGLLPLATLKKAFGETYRKHASPPKELEVSVVSVTPAERRVLLTLPGMSGEDDAQEAFRSFQEERDEQQRRQSPKEMGTFGALLQAKLSEKKPGRGK